MTYSSFALGVLRLAFGLGDFLREPVSVEAAKASVRQRMRRREATFLEKIEGAIFANPRSPYLKLFRAAGCELGDVRGLVGRLGLEGTLRQLQQAGIYVTFEEFKGRKPAVRGSQTFRFRDTDFDNPRVTTPLYNTSGGSRGKPTRIRFDLDYIAQTAPHWALWFAANDWLERPLVFWAPHHTGSIIAHLRCARFGKKFVKWFYPIRGGTFQDRLAATVVNGLVNRIAGFPIPELAPLTEARRVADYLLEMIGAGANPCVSTSPSAAVRLSLAVQEQGLSLRGVTFLLGGEPVTQARKDTIEASGARGVPTYGFSEGGTVGHQCPYPTTLDEVHVCLDAYAVISHSVQADAVAGRDVLLLTSLLPACPKVLLNTQIGDHAVLEARRCGCLFDELGYFQHLHTIRSFEKLTGEGMTFVSSDLFHVLEEVLPRRFGGAPGEYQLLEEQDRRGLPRYTLRVAPEVGLLNESALVAAFLDELGKLQNHCRWMVDLWASADILQVERRSPLVTARGKVLPFRTLDDPLVRTASQARTR